MNRAHVHIVCRNWQEDRIIPRMARALSERLGWTLSGEAIPCDALYLSGYFEGQKLAAWPSSPVAAYFTHREEEPPGNAKAKLYDDMARRCALRIATCRLYAEPLALYGPTVQVAAPLERDRFTLTISPRNARPVVGLSGYTYSNHRKGEDLVKGVIGSSLGQRVEWRASGRGWPVATKSYSWAKMPTFYQGLDVLVCPSRVEGIPMPPLEALACGVSVVIPRGVGLLDELGDAPGVHRYDRGDLASLLAALDQAVALRPNVDREALRAITTPYSLEAWCHNVGAAVNGLLAPVSMPIRNAPRDTAAKRGIYCVAFGAPARASCARMMQSAKKYMPDVPICLCAASPIGGEDILVTMPDSDIGGRRAKLQVYEMTPPEWEQVLYLDADTEVVAPIYQYFDWVSDGWDLVICKDIAPNDCLGHIRARINHNEAADTLAAVGSWQTLQYNGGAWAFQRNERTAAFFRRWIAEWERYVQRDQGALCRALHAAPLKVWLLGNEWNTFPRFQPQQETAGLLHFPGAARRWEGQIIGRIDSEAAWAAVKRFEGKKR